MMKRSIWLMFLLLPAAAAAQTQTPPAPTPDPTPKRRPSMVGYVNDSTIQSQLRVRFDSGYGLTSADRAEFIYAKYGWYAHQPATFVNYDPDAPGPWPGLLAEGDFSQLYLLGEYGFANNRASAFVELPVRWFRPGEWIPGFNVGEKSTGLSDVRFGAKVGLKSSDTDQATVLFQVTTPTGDAAKSLGTNHASLEPAFLLSHAVSDRVGLEAQFGAVFPVGGSAGLPASSPDKFSGSVLYYGLGPSFDVYSTSAVRFAPVVELVGWSVLGGFRTTCGDEACFLEANDPGGNIVNIKVGARIVMRDQNSVYVGFGKALTGEKWYDKIFRLEFRRSF
jgi:Putative MetA-pathway of phenol degradation